MILTGDALTTLRGLDAESVQCCVTSPPYWGLRDYGTEGQLGLEKTPEEYVANLVAVFREVRRVLKKDGTLWLNLGDSYARDAGKGQHKTGDSGKQNYVYEKGGGRAASGVDLKLTSLKPKDLVGIPWMVAFALRTDGWYLRSDIIWHKPNCMPSSVTDRPTMAHEYVFLLAKSERYFYDADAIKETANHPKGPWGKSKPRPGVDICGGNQAKTGARSADPTMRNKRSVWRVTTSPFKGAHFATFPPKLIRPCILAGSRAGDTVLDPFNGAGTTGLVAMGLRRKYIGIEINPAYVAMSNARLSEIQLEAFV